jgi:hypothetical protein
MLGTERWIVSRLGRLTGLAVAEIRTTADEDAQVLQRRKEMAKMKTIEIPARSVRPGDRVVERRPEDGTLVREVDKVSAHLGGREVFLGFKGEVPGLIVRRDHMLKVEKAARAERVGTIKVYSKVAPDAREIGAGDDVVILDDDGGIEKEGVLRDVLDGGMAEVQIGRRWITVQLDRVAHPDSPAAEAASCAA